MKNRNKINKSDIFINNCAIQTISCLLSLKMLEELPLRNIIKNALFGSARIYANS